jgi:predicted nucleotidyltransferase
MTARENPLNPTLQTIVEDLSNLEFVEEVYLFGSRARGDNQERSDVDIAVMCSEADDRDWDVLMKIIENAQTLLKIDCVRFDTLNETNPLRGAILRDKVILFKRRNT